MFERNSWNSVLGVQSEHPGLLVGLDHVDVEGVTLNVLLSHGKVHDNSCLDLVNQSQPLVWDEPRRMRIRRGNIQSYELTCTHSA